ncbi:MAG: PKD domain-containing protein [Thermoplasmata archaeon]|nr:MAG: PKD domain-containing protein [Thermoplasmata archaeon]
MLLICIILILSTLIISTPAQPEEENGNEIVDSFGGAEYNTQSPQSRQTNVVINKLSDGSSYLEMDLTTKDPVSGLYFNSSAAVTLPKNAKIQSAGFDVEGLSTTIPDNIVGVHNFTDSLNTFAYAGLVFNDPPQGPLGPLKASYQFNSTHRTNISAADSLNVTNASSGAGSYAYHLFQFKLGSVVFEAVNLTWVGHGVHLSAPAIYNAKLFYWDGTDFVMVISQTGGGGADYNSSMIIDDEKMLDASGDLHIIAISPAEVSNEARLFTNYVQVQTLKNGTGMSFPYNLTLDIGADDVNENATVGELSNKISLTQDLEEAFQLAVNNSGDGYGDVIVPLKFTSEKLGRINISNIHIVYDLEVLPELLTLIPNSTVIDEDSGWTKSEIDLLDYYADGFGIQNLSFSVNYKQDASEVDCWINQSLASAVLEFYTGSNFYGVREFQVTAKNKGVDGASNTGDEKSTPSNIFSVTVTPTNDPPEIYQLSYPGGHKRAVGANQVKLINSNERAYEDSLYSFVIAARDIDGDNLMFSCNLSDGAGSDDMDNFELNTTTGEIQFEPTNLDLGFIYFNLTVTDSNGTKPLGDYLNVELWVEAVNDAPVITTTGPLVAYEDRWNYFQLEAYDEESQNLIFRSNLTDGMGSDDKENFFIDRDTGEISFMPEQSDVGIINVNVSVEDPDDKIGYSHLQVSVLNMNDPPVILNVGSMAAIKNEYMLFEVDERTWLNLSVTYGDEDGDSATFELHPISKTTVLPANLTIERDSGTIRFFAPSIDDESLARYFINLTADDGNITNGTDYVWLEIQIRNLNDPPVISSCNCDLEYSRVTLSLDVKDPNGDNLKFIWDFGDGSPKVTTYGSGEASHTYARPGEYTIRVTAVDTFNATDFYEYTLNLTVDDFPNIPSSTSQGKEEDSKFWIGVGAAVLIVNLIILSFILFLFFTKRKKMRERKELGIDELVAFGTDKKLGEAPKVRALPPPGTPGAIGPVTARIPGLPPKEEPAEPEKGPVQTKLTRFGEIFTKKKEEE